MNAPSNLSYSWHRFKSFSIHTTNMCAIGLLYVVIKCHVEHISEFGNSTH